MEEQNVNALQEADSLVNGDRQAQYGHPHTDYQCTAEMWSALIERRYGVKVPITPDFACLMMVSVKLSREAGKPKRDNLVDAAGYIACAEKCLDKEAELSAIAETFGPLQQMPAPGQVVSLEVPPVPPVTAAKPDVLDEEPE
jgi:Domain of unknown function (DUF6378)